MGVGASWPLPRLYFPVLGRRVGRAAALSPWRRASAGPHGGSVRGVGARRIPRVFCGMAAAGHLL